MSKAIVGINKSRRGRPKAHSVGLMVRVPPDLITALDRFIREEHPDTSRPEALRLAFRDWAIAHGYIELPPAREDAN